MKHRLEIKNFGPIAEIDIEISSFMLFIGQQASGKSTIAKSVFFFKSFRDDLLKYVLTEINTKNRHFYKSIGSYAKRIRQKFLDYWGSTYYLSNIYLKFYYSEKNWIEITLEENRKYVTPTFSPAFIDSFKSLIENIETESKKFLEQRISYLTTKEIIQSENERNLFFKEIEIAINRLFNEDKDLLFIPAGRSLLSTLTEQLQNLDTRKLDFLMRTFVERINNVKRVFNVGIDDLVLEKKKLTQEKIDEKNVDAAKVLIEKILKGTDFLHGISQLMNSINVLGDRLEEFALHARIVVAKIYAPNLNNSKLIRLKKLLKQNGGTFMKAERNLEEKI